MRADPELFKDKIEVSLDGRQIFYLFFGGAVIASLVFVLGVMVGRRVEARTHVDNQPATSAALDPLAALDELARRPVGANGDDLAFPAALAGELDEPLSEVALGKVDRLLAATAAPPPAGAGGSSQAAERRSEPRRAEPAQQRPSEAEDHAGEAAEADADEPPEPAEAKFTLQLNSFQERAEADAFYEELREAGYDPYVIESEVEDKGTWYRVRLGGYGSYDDAIEAKMTFEERMHIIAYVTRLRR